MTFYDVTFEFLLSHKIFPELQSKNFYYLPYEFGVFVAVGFS